jgi:hypothetical protein
VVAAASIALMMAGPLAIGDDGDDFGVGGEHLASTAAEMESSVG